MPVRALPLTAVACVRFLDLVSRVDFVVGFPPCSEGFSLGLQVSSLGKNQHSKLKFDLETVEKKSHLIKCPLLNY